MVSPCHVAHVALVALVTSLSPLFLLQVVDVNREVTLANKEAEAAKVICHLSARSGHPTRSSNLQKIKR